MRRHLVEVVFERVSLEATWAFVDRITKRGKGISSMLIPHLPSEGLARYPASYEEVNHLFVDPDASLAITLPRVEIPGGLIIDATAWIRPFMSSDYLLEVNFYNTAVAVSGGDALESLHSFA